MKKMIAKETSKDVLKGHLNRLENSCSMLGKGVAILDPCLFGQMEKN